MKIVIFEKNNSNRHNPLILIAAFAAFGAFGAFASSIVYTEVVHSK